MSNYLKIFNTIKSFNKTIQIEGDKSLSIRWALLASQAIGKSTSTNLLKSQDVLDTINCLKKLGVKIKKTKSKKYTIYGKGLGSLHLKKNSKLNFGNSGTLARLLIGILSTTPGIKVNISGDHSLNKRSMKKLISLMREFGAFFLPKTRFNFPLKLISSEMPIGVNYDAGVSAQLKSAVIFAGLNSYGNTVINETQKSRDHTENMLLKNNHVIKIKNKKKKR